MAGIDPFDTLSDPMVRATVVIGSFGELTMLRALDLGIGMRTLDALMGRGIIRRAHRSALVVEAGVVDREEWGCITHIMESEADRLARARNDYPGVDALIARHMNQAWECWSVLTGKQIR
jgi:hypothetical protein